MIAVNLSLSYSVEWDKDTQELTINSPDSMEVLDSEEVVNLVRFIDSIRHEIDQTPQDDDGYIEPTEENFRHETDVEPSWLADKLGGDE